MNSVIFAGLTQLKKNPSDKITKKKKSIHVSELNPSLSNE